MDADLRVVLIHDWLTGMRGGEKVLEVMCRRWPTAPLYTLIHKRGSVSRAIEERPIVTSFLQKLPWIERYYRYTLPLMPWAVDWKLPECDLVFSSSHCVAKGVSVPAGALHLCYCHTPMRYAWHMQDAYFHGPKRWLAEKILARLREWDRRTADGVTNFIANSEVVRRRIRVCYGRDAVVIHPPVDTTFYCPADVPREDYYLILSAFAQREANGNATWALDDVPQIGPPAGRHRRRPGREEAAPLRQREYPVSRLATRGSAARSPAPLCRPVVSRAKRISASCRSRPRPAARPSSPTLKAVTTETVIPWPRATATGMWFPEQTIDCLTAAMEQFERERDFFVPQRLRDHALRFRVERFEEELFGFVTAVAGKTEQRRAA